MHTYIQTYIHGQLHPYIHTYINACQCCHTCIVFHLVMQISDQKVRRTSRVCDHFYSSSSSRLFSATAPKLSVMFDTACRVVFDRLCSTVVIAGRCIFAISALKITPWRVSADVSGICVVITIVFAHGCAGIWKWFCDGIGMWCFAVPLC